VKNHEVCTPIDPPLSGADHGMCTCMVAYVRSATGACILSPLDHNGDPRRSNSDSSRNVDEDDDGDEHGGGTGDGSSPASSSHFSGHSGSDGETATAGHGQ
jgi:hypothetical protein